MTTYGTPLTGAQMKLLRAAGLPDNTTVKNGLVWSACELLFKGENYHLPADHPAYTLLEKGWLDKPNMRLWFGGEKAPDDWGGGDALLQNGEVLGARGIGFWWHDDMGANIIAYIRKDESSYPPDGGLKDQVREPSECQSAFQMMADTVIIKKMTPTEIKARYPKGVQPLVVLQTLGLIKPEPTREERFWAKFPTPYTDIESSNRLKGWVKLALEFERD